MSAIQNIPSGPTDAVSKYINEKLKSFYSEKTATITKEKVGAIRTEATNRIKNIRNVKKTLPNVKTSSELKAYINQKALINYKNALLKGYAFIMKTREFITKETVSYFVMVGSFTDNPEVAKLSLDQLLPGIGLEISKEGKMKLQLNQIDKLTEVVRENAQIMKTDAAQKVINNYKILRNVRKVQNKKGELIKTIQGFSLEWAIRQVNDPSASYETDWEAFYRGGDLKGEEIPEEFQTTNLEVKNITGAWGAQLAQEGTIEMALISIKEICTKAMKDGVGHFKEMMNEFIFNPRDGKNINERLKKDIKKSVQEKIAEALKVFDFSFKK